MRSYKIIESHQINTVFALLFTLLIQTSNACAGEAVKKAVPLSATAATAATTPGTPPVIQATASAPAPHPANFPAADAPPIVRKEYGKTQQDLQAQLSTLTKKTAALEAAKMKAYAESKNHEQVLRAGIESMRKYDVLLTARYVNDKGEFDRGLEVQPDDIANINKLFEGFLSSAPLKGKVSSGHARRTLDWGARRLEELARIDASPEEENNPELEIIAKQLKDIEIEKAKILRLAETIGTQLNPDGARMPASSESKR